MKLKSLVAGIALGVSALAAHADLVQSYALTPGANAGQFNANFDVKQTIQDNSIFVDELTFTPPDAALGSVQAGTVTVSLSSFQNFRLELAELNGELLDFFGSGTSVFTLSFDDLFKTPFKLTLFGSVGDPFNAMPDDPSTTYSYSGSIQVDTKSLPEPGSLALVLGAFGGLMLVRGKLRTPPAARAC